MADEVRELGQSVLNDHAVNISTPEANLIATDINDTDKSKRVILPANCLVILNGQKCQLQINPDSGVLIAYPVKDEEELSEGLTESNELPNNSGINQVVTLQKSDSAAGVDQVSNVETPTDSKKNSGTLPNATLEAAEVAPKKSLERASNAAQGLLQLSFTAEEETDVLSSSSKLPVPQFIIPAAGGLVTTRAITQKQVTAITKLDGDVAINEDEDGGDEKNTETDEQKIKPVLKQYLIQPSSSVLPEEYGMEELSSLGVKTSNSDLEKLKCSECSYQAYYPQQYDKHLRSCHSNDLHKCRCCSFVCLVEGELTKHYTDIHPRNICEVCHYVSEHAYVIKRHMYRHTADGCQCEVCGKIFKDQYILKMHVKMVHMPAEVLFKCEVCAKDFTRKAHLKRHLRTHLTEKAHKCPHCEYRGAEKSDVTKHMLIHNPPKHHCDVCGKYFRHQKNKDLHMKRHTGQRDYKCGVCDFFGYTFTDIRKHIERRHSDMKGSFICDKCGSLFKTEFALQEHKLSWHNNEKMVVVDGTDGGTSSVIVSVTGSMLTQEQVEESSRTSGDDEGEEFTETVPQHSEETETEISDLTITLCQ